MRKYVLFFLLVFLSGNFLLAQCESCSSVSGVIFDHCYTHPSVKGKCAMFTENTKTFYFEDASRKKPKPMAIEIPAEWDQIDLSFLAGLQSKYKKYKLSAGDILFLRDALANWRAVEAVRFWELEAVNSNINVRESGLGYKVLVHGQGAMPQAGKPVSVHYTGYLTDGKKFDSSLDRMQTFKFILGKGQVIKGWDEGVALFPIGTRVLLRIPPDLGYGSRGFPGAIPANSVLYFDVRIMGQE